MLRQFSVRTEHDGFRVRLSRGAGGGQFPPSEGDGGDEGGGWRVGNERRSGWEGCGCDFLVSIVCRETCREDALDVATDFKEGKERVEGH